MKTHLSKLVRDGIPRILGQQGIPFEERIASPDEMPYLLIDKMREEIREFSERPSMEELADMLEVLFVLSDAISPEGGRGLLELVCNEKFKKRGGFSEGHVLISTGSTD